MCPLVVHEMYDGYTAHRPSMTDRRAALTSDSSLAVFQTDDLHLANVGEDGEAVDILPMPLSWRSGSFVRR